MRLSDKPREFLNGRKVTLKYALSYLPNKEMIYANA
jgi:hypothetical protein